MVRFAVDVPVSVTGSSEQVVQILGRYRGKIDESVKTIPHMGPLLTTGIVHTSVSSFRNNGAVLPETAIWHRCRMKGDRKKELVGEISSEWGSQWSMRCIP